MLVPILIFDLGLVAWSLHLMQQAFDRQEFSLMLAGTLVAAAAAGYVSSLFPHGSLFNLFNPNFGCCLNGGDCFTIVLSAIAL
ncbi:hypothetical protein MAESPC_03919 [Microcystis aeruginosa SPC777]|uniref:Uncharacterized protein n=1 Tax=Microcystis aeruginosa SPC777 TaxID=482300 RepID=S3J0E1_MICAE|nr:hypothetical protein MAESPC_03919 [Microcystis aeruginosa SPC777]